MSSQVRIKEMASINLFYAQAEINVCADRESVARALAHLQQAEAILKIAMSELDAPDDASEAVA